MDCISPQLPKKKIRTNCPWAKWSKDGIEQQMQSNFLSHFLMISLLMPFMKGASGTYLLVA